MNNKEMVLENLDKRIQLLDKKEDKLLFKEHFLKTYTKKKIAPLQERISEKIPAQLENTLVQAFSGAFKLIYRNGLPWIEKTFSALEMNETYQKRCEKLDATMGKKNFKDYKRQLKDASMVMGEGIGLGALGISLPDIPVYIGFLLRTCMISAKSHGIDISSEKERYMMLQLIALSVAPKENRQDRQSLLRELSKNIDDYNDVFYDLESAIRDASAQLAQSMLLSRFVMGVPLIGTIGGLYHSNMILRLQQFSDIYYERRLLYKKRTAILREYPPKERE